ncbi:hypothetical protein Tco_0627093 [Tanacetum coccineum]|uniref:Uncharacterized protein n=1 Tax=Tanacetum coccineum TaxID=301880 RepID=A0ABQ4WM92_9ASTR
MTHHTCNLLPHDQVRLPDTQGKRDRPNSYSSNLSPVSKEAAIFRTSSEGQGMKKELATPCVSTSSEKAVGLEGHGDEIDEQELEAHYVTWPKIQEVYLKNPSTSSIGNSAFPNPTAKTMEVLIKTLLMPLSNKTILDSHCFVHELKREMNDDLDVKSLEKEIDELESEKADFSNIYDLLLEECVSKDVTCP